MFMYVSLIVLPLTIESKAKVRDLEVTISTNEKIVWLNVSVNPSHLVSFFDARNHLSNVLFADLFTQDSFADEQAKKITSDAEFHHKVKMLRILKRGNERHHPF